MEGEALLLFADPGVDDDGSACPIDPDNIPGAAGNGKSRPEIQA